MFHNRRILQSVSKPPFVAAASASVWGDHGTNSTLSQTAILNDTVTGVANSYSSVRGTQARSAGKYYFEIKFIVGAAASINNIGIMDNATATGAAMDGNALSNTAANSAFNGNTQSNGFSNDNLDSGWAMTTNDIIGYAADFDNGFFYLHKNGTYFSNAGIAGVPTSGASGTGAVNHTTPEPRLNMRPMIAIWGTPTNSGSAQLITGSGSLTYLPSGYTAWG